MNQLAENAVFIAQTVADGGVLQGRQGIDEAGGEAAEAAVAETGVRLLLDQYLEVPALLLHRLPHDRVRREIHDVVAKRPAEQKFHRQVVNALRIGSWRARGAS